MSSELCEEVHSEKSGPLSPPCPLSLLLPAPVPTSSGRHLLLVICLRSSFHLVQGNVLFPPLSYQMLTSCLYWSAPCISLMAVFLGDLIIRKHGNIPSSFSHSSVLFIYGCNHSLFCFWTHVVLSLLLLETRL